MLTSIMHLKKHYKIALQRPISQKTNLNLQKNPYPVRWMYQRTDFSAKVLYSPAPYHSQTTSLRANV